MGCGECDAVNKYRLLSSDVSVIFSRALRICQMHTPKISAPHDGPYRNVKWRFDSIWYSIDSSSECWRRIFYHYLVLTLPTNAMTTMLCYPSAQLVCHWDVIRFLLCMEYAICRNFTITIHRNKYRESCYGANKKLFRAILPLPEDHGATIKKLFSL